MECLMIFIVIGIILFIIFKVIEGTAVIIGRANEKKWEDQKANIICPSCGQRGIKTEGHPIGDTWQDSKIEEIEWDAGEKSGTSVRKYEMEYFKWQSYYECIHCHHKFNFETRTVETILSSERIR